MWEEEFDLNSVRLCFQASFTQPTGERVQLAPVVSQPIYDNSECRRHTHTHGEGVIASALFAIYIFQMFPFLQFRSQTDVQVVQEEQSSTDAWIQTPRPVREGFNH